MLLTLVNMSDLFEMNKSGLYFQPPITIINSKNIKAIMMSPMGICPKLYSDNKHSIYK